MRTRSASDDPEMFDSSDLRSLRHRIDTSYDDMRRLILLAAIFFLVGILVIMARLQVATEDIFRWAPVIWLLGVVVAGTFMNLFLQCARFFSKRRKRRTRASISSSHLSSLFGNFPDSFPCLAPSPHVGCCRDPTRRIARDLSESKESLPAYEDIVQSTECPPPAYEEAMLSRLSILTQFSSPFKRAQPLYCPVHGKISRSTTLVEIDSPANPLHLATIVDETSQCTPSNQSSPS